MSRFAIEHLPRAAAIYRVTPVDHFGAQTWLQAAPVTSLIRTTELIDAIHAGLSVTLDQSDVPMVLKPGDEALFISLSFGVLLAWAEGKIAPLPEDWRCLLVSVEDSPEEAPVLTQMMEEDLSDAV